MADQGILTSSRVTLTSSQKAPREALGLSSAPRGVAIKRASQDIPGLLRSTTKALMLEIAYVETGNDSTYNQNDRYGRYAVHKNTLINYGYLSDDGTTWLGQQGVSSAATFIASVNLQDRIMERFLTEQYEACVLVGAIKDNDSIATVAGMLAVAYQFQDYTYSTNDIAPNISVIIDSIDYFANNSAVKITTTTNHNLTHNKSFVIKTNSNVNLNGTFTVDKLLSNTSIEYLSPNIGIVEEYGFTRSWTSDGGTISSPAVLSKIDTSYLVSRSANLTVQLANTLSYLGSSDTAYNHYVESNIGDIATEFRQKGISSTTTIDQRRLIPIVDDINTTSLRTTKIVQTALYANIEGAAKQRAIIDARANISILNYKIQQVYQNLPANRAKDWRLLGDVNDSQGRQGALFFNAGKYAITNLNAG